MKCARLYGKMDLRLEEVPVPEIGPDEVLVKLKSAAICGTDVRMLKNGAAGIDENHPLIIGHEMAGVIEEVGKEVTAYQKGMRVAVAPNMGCGICPDCISGNGHMCRDYQALGINLDGGFAEFVKIPAKAVRAGNMIPLEEHVSFAEAAITEALSCVYNGISQCHIKPGEYAVVIGAGPIGIMHAMMAKMSGAAKVFVNDIAKNRLKTCVEIDSSFIPVEKDVVQEVMKQTNGHGADVVITACPVPAAQQNALKMAANYGRICFFGGLPADRQEVPLNSNLIHYKQLMVTGSTRASLKQFQDSLGFVTSGILDVKKLITRRFKLDDIQQGFEYAQAAEGLKNIIDME
ncbi:Sorbitol dehydrogenase [uncultured Roseburia sp.]|uniref:Zinc-dependent dehydrogenase n=1 Tax=Brotonthovivens ammoniilytica TaxID=2981725 RepID=A0ABT2TKY9_9FIRM|nr:zinc-dependent dehydrogenase [Brotonthovivens ammoniilytica]MCU6762777.1 zinc-dependent dehydrogenase [Brotonthovivens ammoniilytica]SCI88476.1 Sorbitol dehydrogenase [uncultured Roseburia sp.]